MDENNTGTSKLSRHCDEYGYWLTFIAAKFRKRIGAVRTHNMKLTPIHTKARIKAFDTQVNVLII